MSLVMVSNGGTDLRVDASVPITDGYTTEWRWVYRCAVPRLYIGDRLEVSAQGEFTIISDFNTEIVTAITLTDEWPYYEEDLFGLHPTPRAGLFVCSPNGGDVTLQMHHWPVTMNGEVTIQDSSFSTKGGTLVFRVRCRSDAAKGGEIVTIEDGYGRMSWDLFRKPTA